MLRHARFGVPVRPQGKMVQSGKGPAETGLESPMIWLTLYFFAACFLALGLGVMTEFD